MVWMSNNNIFTDIDVTDKHFHIGGGASLLIWLQAHELDEVRETWNAINFVAVITTTKFQGRGDDM
jgi:hypothetical protein